MTFAGQFEKRFTHERRHTFRIYKDVGTASGTESLS